MVMPTIIYRPILELQPLDDAGAPDGAAVDVSCDMQSVDLGVDQTLIDVSTFCGKFSIPDDLDETANFGVAINSESMARWAPLVGVTVQARVYDREEFNVAGGKGRAFTTLITFNPALYGPTTPGEARAFDFDVPILSSVVEYVHP